MLTLLLLQLPFLLQEERPIREVTINKYEKDPYTAAKTKYIDAKDLFEDNDFLNAIELLDEILSDGKVKERECFLMIQFRTGDKLRFNFFPYQLRGRALLDRAKSKDKEDNTARQDLKQAEKDFIESIRRGLDTSRPFLIEVRNELKARETKKNSPVTKDPEPEFKATWNKWIAKHKFQDTKKWIESDGNFLSTQKKSTYLADTEKECLTWVTSRCQNFLQSLENTPKPEQITALGSVAFKRTFLLPSRDQLLSTPPSYKWCIAVYKTLQDLRKEKDVVQDLLDHAIAALPLVPKGENGWYRWAEGTAYSIVEPKLKKNSEDARDAPRKIRETLQKESQAFEDQWTQFESKAKKSPSFRTRNLNTLIQFPKEYPGVENLPLTLENALANVEFKNALQDFERNLQSPKGNLTIESRREILRYRIVAGAILLLYDKKSEEQATEKLKEWGINLKRLGGSFKMTGFGSRVEEVFTRLGRNP
jgi:hypothetical protein